MRQVHSQNGGSEPVQVRARGALPIEVEWRGRRFAVASVDASWCIEGRWWLDGERSGVRRRYFRLHLRHLDAAKPEVCVEVFRATQNGRGDDWRLWRVAD